MKIMEPDEMSPGKGRGLMLSVVIPTCHRSSSLRACLDSLLRQTYTNFEVVLVQCAPDSSINDLVAQYSAKIPIRLITKGGGLVQQMNAGLTAAAGDIYIRTDDDIVADDRWLSEIAKA